MAVILNRSYLLLLGLFFYAVPAILAEPGVGFPVVGLANGQSVTVNALNLGTGAYADGSSCAVTLQLLDTDGQVLSESAVRLTPGKASSLKVSRYALTGTGRVSVRGVLLFGYFGGANPSSAVLQQYDCNIVPSLEVFDDDTERTSFTLTAVTSLPASTIPAQ